VHDSASSTGRGVPPAFVYYGGVDPARPWGPIWLYRLFEQDVGVAITDHRGSAAEAS